MKRQIPYWLQEKWQEFATAIAELFSIPAAVVMKLDDEEIEVYLTSDSRENPFKPGEHVLLSGSYCEAVIKTQEELEVNDATIDPVWQNSPQVDLGLINYLGYPLNYPDGVPFGSLCVLSKEKGEYNEQQKKILQIFREIIEQDIALAFYYNDKQSDLMATIRRQHDMLHHKDGLVDYEEMLSTDGHEPKPQISACYFKELSEEVNTSLEAILSLSRVIQQKHVSAEDIETYARGIERKSSRLLERLNSIQKLVCDELPPEEAENE